MSVVVSQGCFHTMRDTGPDVPFDTLLRFMRHTAPREGTRVATANQDWLRSNIPPGR